MGHCSFFSALVLFVLWDSRVGVWNFGRAKTTKTMFFFVLNVGSDQGEQRRGRVIPAAKPRKGDPNFLDWVPASGWRSEDDEFFRKLRIADVSWRGPNTMELDALRGPVHLPEVGGWEDLFEDGKKEHSDRASKPEAAKFDFDRAEWIPTGEPAIVDDGGKAWWQEESEEEEWKAKIDLPEGAWRVVHLGTSSAIPTKKRNVSSTAVIVSRGSEKGKLMMIQDAGENTGNRLLQAKWCRGEGFEWIRYIFITHVHGDHIYGLPGLLNAIGFYTQERRRSALRKKVANEAIDEDVEDPVIQIFAPYGVRSFVRVALHMTPLVGVRFAIRELIPRDSDYSHVDRRDLWRPASDDLFDEKELRSGLNAQSWTPKDEGVPPPHEEEVRMSDIEASEDGTWKLVDRDGVMVRAIPLKHRVPCFGYIYSESGEKKKEDKEVENSSGVDIDMDLARGLGVRGRQYAVLRSGRSVVVSSTGRTVTPEDVMAPSSKKKKKSRTKLRHPRKVVILGDTCDSSLGEQQAMHADVLVHEATFSNNLAEKARIAMHSTAAMAGAFAKAIDAKRLVLTHFSSRYEAFVRNPTSTLPMSYKPSGNDSNGVHTARRPAVGEILEDDDDDDDDEDEEEDFVSIAELVSEARTTYGKENVTAAYDYYEYDIADEEEVD